MVFCFIEENVLYFFEHCLSVLLLKANSVLDGFEGNSALVIFMEVT